MELAQFLEKIARGEVTEAISVYDYLKDKLAPFANAAEKQHWQTYAYWPCADQLGKRSIDFVASEAYIHEPRNILWEIKYLRQMIEDKNECKNK